MQVSFGFIPSVSTGGIFFYVSELYFISLLLWWYSLVFYSSKKNSSSLFASWSSKIYTLFKS